MQTFHLCITVVAGRPPIIYVRPQPLGTRLRRRALSKWYRVRLPAAEANLRDQKRYARCVGVRPSKMIVVVLLLPRALSQVLSSDDVVQLTYNAAESTALKDLSSQTHRRRCRPTGLQPYGADHAHHTGKDGRGAKLYPRPARVVWLLWLCRVAPFWAMACRS